MIFLHMQFWFFFFGILFLVLASVAHILKLHDIFVFIFANVFASGMDS